MPPRTIPIQRSNRWRGRQFRRQPIDLSVHIGKVFVNSHSYRQPDVFRVIGHTKHRVIVDPIAMTTVNMYDASLDLSQLPPVGMVNYPTSGGIQGKIQMCQGSTILRIKKEWFCEITEDVYNTCWCEY
jgi:hypothetical protein